MSNFRGRAPSGLINRETGNYAWVGENGEIIVDGSHCLSDNGKNLLAVDPTDKGITLNRSPFSTEIDEKDLWKTNLSFTGQKCHLNYIAIRPAGEISQACLGVNTHSNIFEDMDFGKNYRIPDVHCWVGYCGANCCTELIKVDEKEGDENG